VFLIYLLCGFLARRVGGAKGGRPFSDFLYGPFILPLDESRVTRNLEIARILLGCFIVHRYLDCFGTAVIGNTEAIRLTMATGVFFGVSIAIGFLTPVVIVLYSSLFLIFPTYISTLGNQVALLTLWVMILLGAGKIWSVDSLMMKWKATRPSIEALYFFSVSPTPENFARVRFFALLIFWGINFSAIGFHFLDEFWLGGDVLQVAMTAGFWNDHFQLFNVLKDKFPLWFDGFCKLGLYIQAFFETFLLPLMFLGWPGRVFVFLQGLSFFTVSLFCINLGYLPVHELILWGILFGYLPAILPFLNRTKGKGRPIMENRFPSHPLDGLIVVAFIVCLTFNLVNLASINGSMFPRKWPWTHILWRTTYRSLGLEAVNVFNRDDLKTGSYRIVLFEVSGGWRTDKAGSPDGSEWRQA
jgi:hypothetical protein